MSEVEIPIWIATHSRGKSAVMAWVRSADAPLACHNTVLSDGSLDESEWSITHRKTGHRVNPSIVYSKAAALALIDIYTPLADWDAITEPYTKRERKELIRAIEQAYEQFEPQRLAAHQPDTGTAALQTSEKP